MKSSNPNHRLVYSSDSGRVCPECARAVKECVCRKKSGQAGGDGIVRIRREAKGRGGKTVTVITDDGQHWNVSPSLLHRQESAGNADFVKANLIPFKKR